MCGTTRDTDDLNAHSFPYLFDPHFLGGKRVSSYTCADCGYVKKTDFSGHIYEYTCAPGSSQHKGVCTICGKQILSQHNFSDGVCTYCGYRPGIDLKKTVTEFATRASLSMDESELDGMERKLLCWPKATPRRPPSLILALHEKLWDSSQATGRAR